MIIGKTKGACMWLKKIAKVKLHVSHLRLLAVPLWIRDLLARLTD